MNRLACSPVTIDVTNSAEFKRPMGRAWIILNFSKIVYKALAKLKLKPERVLPLK